MFIIQFEWHFKWFIQFLTWNEAFGHIQHTKGLIGAEMNIYSAEKNQNSLCEVMIWAFVNNSIPSSEPWVHESCHTDTEFCKLKQKYFLFKYVVLCSLLY